VNAATATEASVTRPGLGIGKFKLTVMILAYLVLVTFLAYLSIDKAINTAQEMGHYQIEETRIFMGEQKAEALKELMNNQAASEEAKVEPAKEPAVDQP